MSGPSPSEFALHADLDRDSARREFAAAGRAQLRPFLSDDSAAVLLSHLRGREDWNLVLNAGEKVFEMDRAGQAALTEAQRRELDHRVGLAARSGFQYRFETIRVPDGEPARRRRDTLLDRFALFLSGGEPRDLLREVTGAADIAFADAQATCYRPGDFLTRHDDDVEGKGRRAAYVLGLTEGWRTDWGGLLMFHDAEGDVEQAYLPRFNALTLFAVPQPHSVGVVAPFAGAERFSVTGWLRTGTPA